MIRLWCPGWRDTWECPVFRAFFFCMLFFFFKGFLVGERVGGIFCRLASVFCFLPEFFFFSVAYIGFRDLGILLLDLIGYIQFGSILFCVLASYVVGRDRERNL